VLLPSNKYRRMIIPILSYRRRCAVPIVAHVLAIKALIIAYNEVFFVVCLLTKVTRLAFTRLCYI